MSTISLTESNICRDKIFSSWHSSFMRPLFEIGDVVRKLRLTKAKLSIVDFAHACGLNKATICKIEGGANFKAENLEKIAKALGHTVPELYSYLAPVKQSLTDPATKPDDVAIGVPPKRRSRFMR